MAKRYGRNQKRKHLAEIDRLVGALADAEWRVLKAERSIAVTRSAAFEDFAKDNGLYAALLSDIARAIGDRLGEQLVPYAQQLMAAAEREAHRPLARLRFDDSHPFAQKIDVLRVDIAPISCSVLTS